VKSFLRKLILEEKYERMCLNSKLSQSFNEKNDLKKIMGFSPPGTTHLN
jgi:hypothetical protein